MYKQIHLIAGLEGRLPFTVEDATRPDTEIETTEEVQYKRVLLDTRLNNRVIDLRVGRSSSQLLSPNPLTCILSDTNQSSCIQTSTWDRFAVPRIP